MFFQVAREILRVDFNLLKKTAELDEDKRLLLKSLPAKATGNSSSNASSTSTLHEVSRSVICDLLNFLGKIFVIVKFIYSVKATKFCEISTVDLSYVVPVKFTVEILWPFQNI